MNAPKTSAGPFASVRSSRDLSLAAFVGAVLVAFALQVGAFIPGLGAPPAPERARETERTAARAVVARRAPAASQGSAAAPAALPCTPGAAAASTL